MTCDDVQNAIELIAAGEMTPDAQMASHLATCRSCASALETARRIDALLRQRPVPAPPSQFTARTMASIRRARWRNEQMIDWGFNAALALVALTIVAGLWIVFSRSGFTFVGNDAMQLFGAGMRTFVQRVSPSLPVYALATMLLITALGIWWWAERDAPI
jgi:anti-sigma factor RsiW